MTENNYSEDQETHWVQVNAVFSRLAVDADNKYQGLIT